MLLLKQQGSHWPKLMINKISMDWWNRKLWRKLCKQRRKVRRKEPKLLLNWSNKLKLNLQKRTPSNSSCLRTSSEPPASKFKILYQTSKKFIQTSKTLRKNSFSKSSKSSTVKRINPIRMKKKDKTQRFNYHNKCTSAKDSIQKILKVLR